jgi:hypothetical protein
MRDPFTQLKPTNSMPSMLKTAWFWVCVAAALLATGFSSAMFLGKYAEASDLKEVSDKFNAHVTEEKSHVDVLQSLYGRTEEDIHSMREQVNEIAKGTGSRIIPVPSHPPLKN